MIKKDFRYHGDQRLEDFLNNVSRLAAVVRTVEYTGNGVSGKLVDMDMTGISFVLAQRTAIAAGIAVSHVIAWKMNPSVSYIVGGSSITDGILEFTKDGVVVGSNSVINGAGINYILIGV